MTTDFPHIQRIVRFSLTTADAERAAQFYEAAFGCRRIGTDRLGGPDFERLICVDGEAKRITLRLGRETVELLQFDVPGRRYPQAASSYDLFFQHFAIVVPDMERAFQRLSGVAGWQPISMGGPQRLPASSGGVIAFKFRDPEGHPLELLAFPESCDPRWQKAADGETCLGIDHTAIGASNTGGSVAFYESFGLAASARSFNYGSAQQRLDDLADVEVDVTALAPPDGTPHLELLCYRNTRGGCQPPTRAPRGNDIVSTRIVFEGAGQDGDLLVRDPDGHALLLVSRASPRWPPAGGADQSSASRLASPPGKSGGHAVGRRPFVASPAARHATERQ